ncbi:hypothetical protein GCM10009077_19010 [Roseibium denhamense]
MKEGKNATCRPDEAARSGTVIHFVDRMLSMALADGMFHSRFRKILNEIIQFGEKSVHPQNSDGRWLPDKLTLL